MKLGTQSNTEVHGAGWLDLYCPSRWGSNQEDAKPLPCLSEGGPFEMIWVGQTQNWNASLISENYWDMQFPVECIAWRQLLKTTHRQGKKINGKESFCCFAEPDVAWLIQAIPDSRSLNVKAVSIDLKQVKCDTPWASIGEGVSHNELRRPVYLHLLLLRCVDMIRNIYDFELC